MSLSENIDQNFDVNLWSKKLEGYSCADIANLCRDSVQFVFDRKTSFLNTQQFLNLPTDQAKIIVTNADFEKAVSLRKSSVDSSTIKRYEEWRDTKGAE